MKARLTLLVVTLTLFVGVYAEPSSVGALRALLGKRQRRERLPRPRKAKSSPPPPTKPAKKPNFLIILVDDQDQLLNSTHRAYMPNTNRLVVDQGLTLRNFVASTAWCCPSRVSLLTGLFTHNHNITSVKSPTGGYDKFLDSGLGDSSATWLPSLMQGAGYSSYFVGKFINGFTASDSGVPPGYCPKGFDVLDALIEPFVYTYWGPAFSYNCGPGRRLPAEVYNTDAVREKTVAYIKEAAAKDKPFFMQINPIAPHNQCVGGTEGDKKNCWLAVPHTKYAKHFLDAKLPRSANYRVPLPDIAMRTELYGPAPKVLSDTALNREYVLRLQSMASVDDLVEEAVAALSEAGVLDNTYIIYTSDNGFHMGNHDADANKMMPWEEDVRVPLFIRGPGIPAGRVSDYQATMVDLPATVAQLGGVRFPSNWDGYPIPFHRLLPADYTPRLGALPFDKALGPQAALPAGQDTYFREAVSIEMWIDMPGAFFNRDGYRSVRVCTSYLMAAPAAYRAAQLAAARPDVPGATLGLGNLLWGADVAERAGGLLGGDLAEAEAAARACRGAGCVSPVVTGTCYKYTVWCFGSRELFDLGLDPHEVNNIYDDPRAARLVGRLDALLSVMSYCKGERCRTAYGAAVRDDSVTSLAQLMDPQYDALIARLPRFKILRCSPAYLPSNEESWYRGSD